jgi:sulfate permease, SulP family
MAFAISSGLSPQAGIYTAIVAGGLISLLGGSRVQIGGPTGAFVVIVAGIVANHGVEGLFLCTLMAGGLLVVLGATGIGSAVRFIPRPVVVVSRTASPCSLRARRSATSSDCASMAFQATFCPG